jgi:hypothetical protein
MIVLQKICVVIARIRSRRKPEPWRLTVCSILNRALPKAGLLSIVRDGLLEGCMPRWRRFRLVTTAGCILAAGVPLSHVSPAASAQSLVPPEILAPHRAVYELSLIESRDRSGVKEIHGRLVYEFARDGCSAFSLNYRQMMSLQGGEGKGGIIDFRSNTVEDDAAREFSFNSSSEVGGQPGTKVGGLAERGRDGRIEVTLQLPEPKTATIPAAAMFPTQHLRRILAAARAGQFSLAADVFDGGEPGDSAGPSLTLIGNVLQPAETSPDAIIHGAGLEKLPRWPVTVSYFESEAVEGDLTPKFTFSAEIYENGIARALRLDYGTFVVTGKLIALERLPPGECKR